MVEFAAIVVIAVAILLFEQLQRKYLPEEHDGAPQSQPPSDSAVDRHSEVVPPDHNDNAADEFEGAEKVIKWMREGFSPTAAITLIAAIIYWLRLSAMRNQQRVMQAQVDEMRLENRAWVGPASAGIQSSDKKPLQLLILLGNTGKEPALHFEDTAMPVGADEATIKDYLASCKSGKEKMTEIGAIYPSSTTAYTLRTDVPATFSDKTKTSVVAGCFLYATRSDPPTSAKHFTTFCFYWAPTTGADQNTWSFCPFPFANDAN